MIRLAVAGLGKMGLSHHALINAHPGVEVVAVCDSTAYLLAVLHKYTGVRTYNDFDAMLAEVDLDAIIIATPSSLHATMVTAALNKGIHVFCEKPFCLDCEEGEAAVRIAHEKGLVNQIGYHCRFIGTFQEVRRLLDVDALGGVTHMLAEAYGPVVLRPKHATWRTRRAEGGGCLYDYASHPLNLINWYNGPARAVGGSVLNRIFSADTEDEVSSTLYFENNKTAQISVNWSDGSYRKMSTKVTIWGRNGCICADRQELQVYLRDLAPAPKGYHAGWNVRDTTELTGPVNFYLRGEEYSAQLDYFIRAIEEGQIADNVNSFASALQTDRAISMLIADAEKGPSSIASAVPPARQKGKKSRFWGRR